MSITDTGAAVTSDCLLARGVPLAVSRAIGRRERDDLTLTCDADRESTAATGATSVSLRAVRAGAAGLTREQAMALVVELTEVQTRLEGLRAGLRQLQPIIREARATWRVRKPLPHRSS
jgi:hypothetical protein